VRFHLLASLFQSNYWIFESNFVNSINNKTENAFSPLPMRTKASNAEMTACHDVRKFAVVKIREKIPRKSV
jgi:hypothetical protein